MIAREKIPSEKNIAIGNFLLYAKFQRYGNVLDFCVEEAVAALFQT